MSGGERPGLPGAAAPRRAARAPARPLPWLVPAVWVGGWLPVAVLILDAYTGELGANPVQRATFQTGLLTLALLILSLACTPLRLVTGWTWPARIRRALGLLAFGYALLHFLIYLFDHGFDVALMTDDIVKRPFITVGFTALLLMVPLALTSGKDAVKRLGFQRWTRVHQLAYASVILGGLHYYWGVKKDHTSPLIYAGAIALLFALRWLWPRIRPTGRKAARAAR